MNTKPDDGGPAFPQAEYAHIEQVGMSLRDYFIAHAPAEPQPWFCPNVAPRPEGPARPDDLTTDESQEWQAVTEGYMKGRDSTFERVRSHFIARDIFCHHLASWEKELAKQRYIQWPAAWADAMLAERGVARAPASGVTISADPGPDFTRLQVLRDGVPIAFQNIPTDSPNGLVSVLLRELIGTLDAAGESIMGLAAQGGAPTDDTQGSLL